jgi:sarcosine oxidase
MSAELPNSPWDVIVVGLGGHGSAAFANLAGRENLKVLGIEKFNPAHNQGSSHGKSRIIRTAYFEDPRYVPLLQRSFHLWRELQEQNPSLDILRLTGGIMLGSPTSDVVTGTIASAQKYDLDHEILSADDIKERFPIFEPSAHEIGVLEKNAGYLVPENCVSSYIELGKNRGGEAHFEEEMISWNSEDSENGDIITVETSKSTYRTKKLILTVGAWAPELYGQDIPLKLHVERRVLYWFEPTDLKMYEVIYICIKDVLFIVWIYLISIMHFT